METTLIINGMTCANCVKHVREALEGVPGVSHAEVDLASGVARVTHDHVEEAAMIAAVEEEGYEVTSTP